MRDPRSLALGAGLASDIGSHQPLATTPRRLLGPDEPSSLVRAGSPRLHLPSGEPVGAVRREGAYVARTTDERAESCQGRVSGEHARRMRPCARRPTLRVTGTGRLTADLCTQHARMAVDRPGLVREWLHREEAERGLAGRAPAARLAGGRTAVVMRETGQMQARAGADLVLRVAAELASLAVVRAALSRALTSQAWPERLHPLVLLAVGEALANAIEHGSPEGGAVEVGLTVTSEWAIVQVADSGRMGTALPLDAPVPPCPTSPRGRGRLLMGSLSERVEVRSGGQGTSVLLRFGRVVGDGRRQRGRA